MNALSGRRAPLLAALVAAGSILGTAAQTPTRDRPFPEVRDARRWGPFLVDPSFIIDNIGYDDNIYLTSPVEKAPQRSDVIVSLGPDITAQTQFGPRAALTLHDRLRGEVFFQNSNLNHADNEFDGQFDLLLGPVLLTTKGSFAFVRDRPYSETDQRTRRDERKLSQALRIFLTPTVDLGGRVGRLKRRYSDPDLETVTDPTQRIDRLDRDETETAVDVGWRPAGRARFFLSGTRKKYDFVSNVEQRDSTDERGVFGIEFSPTAFLTGRLTIGRARLTKDDPTATFKEFDGTVSETALTYRPTGASRITAKYKRDVAFSVFEDNLYYLETQRSLDFEWFLGSKWGLQAGASRGELDYPDRSPNTVPADQKRRDEIDNIYAGLIFRLQGGLQLGVRYGVRDRTSNLPLAEDRSAYLATTGGYEF